MTFIKWIPVDKIKWIPPKGRNKENRIYMCIGFQDWYLGRKVVGQLTWKAQENIYDISYSFKYYKMDIFICFFFYYNKSKFPEFVSL